MINEVSSQWKTLLEIKHYKKNEDKTTAKHFMVTSFAKHISFKSTHIQKIKKKKALISQYKKDQSTKVGQKI